MSFYYAVLAEQFHNVLVTGVCSFPVFCAHITVVFEA